MDCVDGAILMVMVILDQNQTGICQLTKEKLYMDL